MIASFLLLAPANANGQTAEQSYQHAVAWANQGRDDQALAHLDRAIQLAPAWWPPYLKRGTIRLRQGLSDLAVSDFSRVIALDPSNAEAFYRRSTVWRRRGRAAQAIADLDRAIGLDPGLVPAYLERGELLLLAGKGEAALGDANEAVRLRPSEGSAYLLRGIIQKVLGRYEPALADYDRAIELDPNDRNAYWNRSRLRSTCPDPRVRNGRLSYQDAVRLLEIEGWKDPGALAVLAAAYAECGDFTHAVEYQERAIAAAPPAEAGNLPLRECLDHYRAKQPCREPALPGRAAVPPAVAEAATNPGRDGPPAQASERKPGRPAGASTLSPDHPIVARAHELFRAGKLKEAERELREAIERSPGDLVLRSHLAATLMGQNKPALAEPEFREIVSRAATDAMAHLGLATAILAQPPVTPARADEMIASLTESLRLKPDLEMSYKIVGPVFSAAGRPEEGTKLLEDAARERDSGLAHYYLAENLDRLKGQEMRAVEQYLRAIGARLPDRLAARAHARLGTLYEAWGRPGDALPEYRAASKLVAPESTEARSLSEAVRRLEGADASGRHDGDQPEGPGMPEGPASSDLKGKARRPARLKVAPRQPGREIRPPARAAGFARGVAATLAWPPP